MKPNCIICNSQSEYLLNKDGFDLYKCDNCSLVFVYPQPKPEFLRDEIYSYESGYQSNKKGNYGDSPDKKTKEIIKKIKSKFNSGKLLDIGCSSGEFVYFARKEGFDTYGVELNRRTAEIAKAHNPNIFNGFLKDIRFQSEFFDIIFLGDIIEHVNSPDDFINECKRILKKGGMIVISTPNLDCIWSKMTLVLYKLFSIPWSSVTPPYHLFQFSYNNLNKFMDMNGFNIYHKFFLRSPRLAYELGSLHLLKRWKNKRSFFNLFFMFFSFSIYTILYSIDILLTPFKSKDFSMIVFYIKK